MRPPIPRTASTAQTAPTHQTDGKAHRARLLLVAYACSPRRGSEPAVGWNRALQAAREHDVVVLCEEHEFGPEIREFLRQQGPIAGLEFEFLPMSRWERRLARTGVLYYTAYNLWHRRAARRARQLHAARPFDLVHQVNYCGFREPGYCWQLGIPFVWGPLGGAQNLPPRFLGEVGLRAACREVIRSALNEFQLRFRPRVRAAVRHSAAILVANTTNQQAFQRVHGVRPETMVETGLVRVWPVGEPGRDQDPPSRLRDPACPLDAQAPDADPPPLRILWAGQFLPFKGLSLLLKALAPLRDQAPFELRVLGDGPCRHTWRRLAERLQLTSHIDWLGWLPHHEAQRQFGWADVFVFTSLRDTTGSVILESLAAGVPVICLDHQGGRDVINSDCGWKIRPDTPGQVIRELRELVAQLSQDRSGVRNRAAGARLRAEELTWDRNGQRLSAIYRRVLQGLPEPGVTGQATRDPRPPAHEPSTDQAPRQPTPGEATNPAPTGHPDLFDSGPAMPLGIGPSGQESHS